MRSVFFVVFLCSVLAACSDKNKELDDQAKMRGQVIRTQVAQVDYGQYQNVDLNAVALPSNAGSVDSWKIAYRLLGIDSRKGEFEKTSEFQNRLSKITSDKLIGDLVLEKPIALKVNSRDSDLSFDADREVLRFSISNNFGGTLVESRALDAAGDKFQTKELAMEGLIKYYWDKERKIVSGKENLRIRTGNKIEEFRSFVGSIPATSVVAKDLKEDVDMYVVGRVVSPFLEEKLSFPHDYDEKEVNYDKVMPFKIDGIWMVSRKTGKILTKQYKLKRGY